MGNQLPLSPLKALQPFRWILVAFGERSSAHTWGAPQKGHRRGEFCRSNTDFEGSSWVSSRRWFFPLRFRLLPVRSDWESSFWGYFYASEETHMFPGTWGHGLVVMLGWWLGLVILVIFPNLYDSVILYYSSSAQGCLCHLPAGGTFSKQTPAGFAVSFLCEVIPPVLPVPLCVIPFKMSFSHPTSSSPLKRVRGFVVEVETVMPTNACAGFQVCCTPQVSSACIWWPQELHISKSHCPESARILWISGLSDSEFYIIRNWIPFRLSFVTIVASILL